MLLAFHVLLGLGNPLKPSSGESHCQPHSMAGRGPGLGRERNGEHNRSLLRTFVQRLTASPADTAHTGIFRGLKFYLEWTPDAKMFNDILRLIRVSRNFMSPDTAALQEKPYHLRWTRGYGI